MYPLREPLPAPLKRQPRVQPLRRWGARIAALCGVMATAPVLGGCQIDILDPAGPIGAQEKSLILVATGLMLLIVVPVIALTLLFAWRYRASNTDAAYTPDWEHSNQVELVIWIIPCLIIIALGAVTWTSTHRLDPYRRLDSKVAPMEVDVVALDWKWLFIYPQQNIASVNELALPVGVPVRFRLTSASVMNSFFIPRLGSQIYTMPGMETKLSLMASQSGVFQGLSANYSGGGFSDMTFRTLALNPADFARWVGQARAAQGALTLATYTALAKPGDRQPTVAYRTVEPSLYHDILNKCANGAQCMDASMKMSQLDQAIGGKAAHCDTPKPRGL